MQNPALSFGELYEQARASVPVVADVGNGIVENLRRQNPGLFDNIEFQNGPLKALDRAQAKITGDYSGDHTQISDLARGRIVVDSPEQIEAIRTYLAQNREALGIETMKDRFANPSDTHYRDINIKMRLPNGHIAELQINHRGLLNASKRTHDPYEQVQDIDRRAKAEGRMLTETEARERQAIMDNIRDIHDGPARQAGLDTLLSEDGRAKLTTHANERVTPGPLPDAPDNRVNVPGADDGGLGRMVGRLGMIGGVVAGGYFMLRGEFAAAAEAAIPGGATAVAGLEGRPAEAVLATVEEFTGPGTVIGEIARPVAQGLGLDVNNGILQNALSGAGRVELSPQDREFYAIYDALPDRTAEGMPPEVESLVELKRMITASEANLATVNARTGSIDYDLAQERLRAERQLGQAQDMFSQQYDALAPEARADIARYLQERNANADAPQTAAADGQPQGVQPAARPPFFAM